MTASDENATCPNCGAARSGKFCPLCGQSNKTYLRATWEIVREALDEFLGYDSRALRTAKALLTPGKLTLEYRAGRRASYLPPVRLYLLVSVVFFAVVSLDARNSRVDPFESATIEDRSAGAGTFRPDPEMDRMYIDLTRVQRDRLRSVMEAKGVLNDDVRRHMDELDAANPPPTQPESTLRAALTDRMLDLVANPRAAWEKVVNNLPIAMFATLPIYAACLKLLYRRRFYAEHLVFALHLHAFLFAIGTFIVALPDSPAGAAALAAVWTSVGVKLAGVLKLAGIVYYYLALHAVYAERWGKAIVKFVLINAAHATVIGLSILVTGALAVLVL